jgi:hypothetical protein
MTTAPTDFAAPRKSPTAPYPDVAPPQQGYPALPVGADPEFADDTDWQPAYDGYPAYRCVWSPPFNKGLDVRAVVTQLLDGTIETDGEDAPHIHIGSDHYYTPEAARELAAQICAAADLADRWAGR